MRTQTALNLFYLSGQNGGLTAKYPMRDGYFNLIYYDIYSYIRLY